MQVAGGICPLVRCMIDESKKEFFQQTVHWPVTVTVFMQLVYVFVQTEEVVPDLLQYEGLVDLLVQSLFWKMYRLSD